MKRGDAIEREIHRRASLFVDDNFTDPTPAILMIVKNAMLIGATIAIEAELTPPVTTWDQKVHSCF